MSEWETTGKSNDWYTPKYIFDALGCQFDVDVAAPFEGPRYVPTKHWISQDIDDPPWKGFIWMNPPFGPRNGILPWLKKFEKHGNGVSLVPDRTSAPWFQWFAPKMDAVLFLSPKVEFERPDGSIGKSPGSGTALFAKGLRGVAALRRGHRLGWYVEIDNPSV